MIDLNRRRRGEFLWTHDAFISMWVYMWEANQKSPPKWPYMIQKPEFALDFSDITPKNSDYENMIFHFVRWY